MFSFLQFDGKRKENTGGFSDGFLDFPGKLGYNPNVMSATAGTPGLPREILSERKTLMIYTAEVQHMCPVAKGAYHGPAPIPEEGKWVQAKEIKDISGFTHGVGWCAP